MANRESAWICRKNCFLGQIVYGHVVKYVLTIAAVGSMANPISENELIPIERQLAAHPHGASISELKVTLALL